ncbi:MAG: hypothetical protein LBG58_14335 [Planctomycetaceae bacterium]|jgi:hypothetical protein|nr:hypothetical protein [Planctomycetaceae bacterium]
MLTESFVPDYLSFREVLMVSKKLANTVTLYSIKLDMESNLPSPLSDDWIFCEEK